MNTVAILCVFVGVFAVSTGLVCECNAEWSEMIDRLRASGNSEMIATLGFLECHSNRTCNVDPSMCAPGSACHMTVNNWGVDRVFPVCSRTMLPNGQNAFGCGWDIRPYDTYDCVLATCESFKAIGTKCDKTKTPVVPQYVCDTGNRCNKLHLTEGCPDGFGPWPSKMTENEFAE